MGAHRPPFTLFPRGTFCPAGHWPGGQGPPAATPRTGTTRAGGAPAPDRSGGEFGPSGPAEARAARCLSRSPGRDRPTPPQQHRPPKAGRTEGRGGPREGGRRRRQPEGPSPARARSPGRHLKDEARPRTPTTKPREPGRGRQGRARRRPGKQPGRRGRAPLKPSRDAHRLPAGGTRPVTAPRRHDPDHAGAWPPPLSMPAPGLSTQNDIPTPPPAWHMPGIGPPGAWAAWHPPAGGAAGPSEHRFCAWPLSWPWQRPSPLAAQ